MKKNLVFFLTLIFAIFCTSNSIATPRCSCNDDRILKLQYPPMYGQDIKEIQVQLQQLGFYNDFINGVYDKNMEKAVRDFQKSEGLLKDGVVGPKTIAKLAQIYEAPVSSHDTEKPTGQITIAIDTIERQLIVFSDGKPYKSFPVAVGKFETPTPIGLFTITEKDAWGEGFGSRWMRLSVPWGVYGIHGTNKPWSIGGFESAGCIRMHNNHVEQMYEWVDIGTKVFILGGIDGPFTFGLKALTDGSKGSDVIEVQKRLTGFGFYNGKYDGDYGFKTQQAVKAFQRANGLEPSGNVDAATYEALGIVLFE